jgi:hypothetical protein
VFRLFFQLVQVSILLFLFAYIHAQPVMLDPTGKYQAGIVMIKVKADAFLPVYDAKTVSKSIPFTPQWQQLIDKYQISRIQPAAKLVHPVLKRWYQLNFNPAIAFADICAALKQFPEIEIAEAKVICYPFQTNNTIPNDYNPQTLWHLDKIAALDAWAWAAANQHKLGNAVIKLAIVDDAVQIDHEDLQDNIYINTAEVPDNGIDDDFNGYVDDYKGYDVAMNDNDANPPSTGEVHSHGTHCAGIAGAVTNNNKGVAAVSYNRLKIIPVRSTRDGVERLITDGYEGVQYAIAAGAQIISMSWGSDQSSYGNDVIQAAADAGIVLFAAAGNDNQEANSFPCGYPNVICIGASGLGDKKTTYSDYGAKVDLVAPGDIVSTIYSRRDGNAGYSFSSGTSMATPLAAGAAAFILSCYPNLDPKAIEFALKAGADDINALNPTYINKLGSGRLNLRRSLEIIQHPVVCGSETLQKNFVGTPTAIPDGSGSKNSIISGRNSAKDKGFAELFDYHIPYYYVSAVAFDFATAISTSNNDIIEVFIWPADADNKPNYTNPLASTVLSINTIKADIAANRRTIAVFDPPVAVSHKFFAGILFQIPGTGDTVALKTNSKNDNTRPGAGWILNEQNQWLTFHQRLGYELNLAIFPIVINRLSGAAAVTKISAGARTGTQNTEFTFRPATTNALLYQWDFGDGTTAIGGFVTHKYTADKEYVVTLYSRDRFCAAIDTFHVQVGSAVGFDEKMFSAAEPITLFPNPATATQDWIQLSRPAKYIVFDFIGREIFRNDNMLIDKVPTTGLSQGIYWIYFPQQGYQKLIRQ